MMARLNIFLAVVLLLSCFWLIRSSYESRRLFVELDKAQNQAQELQTDHDRLVLEKRAQATPLMGHATLKPRFDRQLFRTRSTVIQDYLAEAQTNLDELRHAVENEQQEQVAWLAEHLTEQITALHREIAAWPLRAWDSASPGLGKWQRKRLENQEFERRLFEMKREREVRLNNSETLEEQQLLMREISALEGRIVRCRQALDDIERVIERLTR